MRSNYWQKFSVAGHRGSVQNLGARNLESRRRDALGEHVFERIAKFFGTDRPKGFATGVELFGNTNHRFAHHAMGLFRTTSKDEVLSAGEPLLAVLGIERQAYEGG